MKVSKIEAKSFERKKLRVAAYCRVSTESDEQQNSFEAQKAHYEASRSARRKEPVIYTEFEMDEPTKSFDDPFEQAEYIYSLIGVK